MPDFKNTDLNEEKRRRQMAILKASNQMLREAQETALSRTTDELKREELKQQFARAIDENKSIGMSYLHATEEEIEKSSYNEADPLEVEKYKKYLEKRGITDDELHRKDSATITVSSKKDAKNNIPRRKRRGSKKDLGDDYEPLANEKEIMERTLVKDEKQIEQQIQKNEEYAHQTAKRENDKFSKLEDDLTKAALNDKVKINNIEDNERVKVDTKKEENTLVKKQNEETIKTTNVQTKKTKNKDNIEFVRYDFDFENIPSYVQYDVIPLPSKGQCYPVDSPLRCGRIPVAYLTASDENIISSPNVYRDGKLFDIILGRKILDKRIKVNDIISGDRDAIILWLRATSYGEDFPITATNPNNGKQYDAVVNLSQFDYYNFFLNGDDDGYFDFETSNGDNIKFRFFTADDEGYLKKKISSEITDQNKLSILQNVNNINEMLKTIEINDEDKKMMLEDVNEIIEIIGSDLPETLDDVYPNIITEQMIMHTVSVNGNNDREYIRNYIENMRTKDAMNYRNYFNDNKPGVDFNFSVNIPESDGGGSFATFLRVDDTIFINF